MEIVLDVASRLRSRTIRSGGGFWSGVPPRPAPGATGATAWGAADKLAGKRAMSRKRLRPKTFVNRALRG